MLRKTISLLWLAVMMAVGCGKSATAPAYGTDPMFQAIVRLGFDTLYPVATTRLAVRVQLIVDTVGVGGVEPQDATDPSSVRGGCMYPGAGSNGNGERYHFIVTVTPTNRADSTPVGPVYETVLYPFPDPIPYPAPWGRDPEHLLLWKLKLTDASGTLPTDTLSFQLDTLSASRMNDSRTWRETGCETVLP